MRLIAGLVAALAASPAVAAEDEGGFIGIMFSRSEDPKGFKVEGLVEDGPAAKAGLKEGDVVTKIDGKEFDDNDAFAKYVRGRKPGDTVTLKVLRDGKEKEVKVTAGKRPEK